MSFYNLLNGVNQKTPFILALIAKKMADFPRFRDVFVGKLTNSDTRDQFGIPIKQVSSEPVISVYTRSGGNNRLDYAKEIALLQADPLYIEDYDDSFDSTYMTFCFKVPDHFLPDLQALEEGRIDDLSVEYLENFPAQA